MASTSSESVSWRSAPPHSAQPESLLVESARAQCRTASPNGQETLSLDVEAMCRFRAHGSW